MSFSSMPVERHVSRAARTQKARQWLSASLTCASLGLVGILGLGMAMTAGWIEYRATAVGLIVGLFGCAFLVWSVATIICWLWPVSRSRVVREMEKRESNLAERLSTIVHLDEQLARPSIRPTLASPVEKRAEYEQQQREEEVTRWFRHRIERQAAAILTKHVLRSSPFPWSVWWRVSVFLLLSCSTVWYFNAWDPWSKLKRGGLRFPPLNGIMPAASRAPDAFDIPAPDGTVVEEPQVLGEVRITEPGADLRISRLDVVPLQIEAATSTPIRSVHLHFARNGGPTEVRDLPQPKDPSFAVLATEIDAAAMQLADGDILVYFAVAITTTGQTYRSNSFLLEVAPLLADVEQLPGGEAGEPSTVIDQAADLVAAQADVLRRVSDSKDDPTAEAELAELETRLATATKVLQARVESMADPHASGRDPNRKSLPADKTGDRAGEKAGEKTGDRTGDRTGEKAGEKAGDKAGERAGERAGDKAGEKAGDASGSQSDSATEARRQLELAAQALRDGNTKTAQKAAQTALQNLAEFRQQLERAVATQREPSAIADSSSKPPAPPATEPAAPPAGEPIAPEEPAPRSVAERQSALDQLRAQRDRDTAIGQTLGDLANREQQLRDQLPTKPAPRIPEFTAQQEQLIVDLEQVVRTHGILEERFPQETQAARQALRQANEELRGASLNATMQVSEAVRALRELASAHQSRAENDRLRDAFRLKRLMDEQAEALRELANSTAEKPREQLESEAKATKDVVEQLRQLSSQSPLENDFDKTLRDLLQGQTPQKLDQQCQGICNGGSASERGQAASSAAKTLQSLSKAFEQSQPASGLGPRHQAAGNQSADKPAAGTPASAQDAPRQPAERNVDTADTTGQNPAGKPSDGKAGEGKSGEGKPGETKSGEGKPGETKSGEGKSGEGKSGEAKPGEGKAGEAKSGEGKSGEGKPGETKSGEGKPGDQNNGRGEFARGQAGDAKSASSTEPSGSEANSPGNVGKPDSAESLERGFRALESLARSAAGARARGATMPDSADARQSDAAEDQQRSNGRLSTEDQQRLRREALGRLTAGLYGKYGHNDETDDQVRALREKLAGPTEQALPVDWQLVDDLRDALQRYRREQAVDQPANLSSAETTLVSPESLPPAYRQPVRNYFQKLSEPRR